MILIDSNVLMYAAGTAHPHREPCAALLERIALERVEAITDVEVLQEILHRYRAIGQCRIAFPQRVVQPASGPIPSLLPPKPVDFAVLREGYPPPGKSAIKDGYHWRRRIGGRGLYVLRIVKSP